MSEGRSFLAEWAIRFLKNKDMVKKEIKSIDRDKEGFDFCISYKDGERYFLVEPLMGNETTEKLKKKNNVSIFTLNNRANLKFCFVNWKILAEVEGMKMYFANPFSERDKVWIISPFIHDKICDKASLETGLKSMSGMVDEITNAELEMASKEGI